MTAQPSGQPSEQPPRWRATRGPFMVSDGGQAAAGPQSEQSRTSYYPGGDRGGYYTGGPQGPTGPNGMPPDGSAHDLVQNQGAKPQKSTGMIVGGVALVLLGFWVVAVVFPWDRELPKGNGPVLTALAALILLGFGFHLLINDPPRSKPDAKAEETSRNISLALMVIGAVLSVVLLREDNPVLLLPSVLTSLTLFVAGFVTLLKPKD